MLKIKFGKGQDQDSVISLTDVLKDRLTFMLILNGGVSDVKRLIAIVLL